MFGLMRHAPRLPYCGTCKTIGALYGHRARVVLNYDMAFLAELLLDVSAPEPWLPAYRSFNCLSLPSRRDPLPLALEYSATASVALAHFQVEDRIADSGRLRWKTAARYLSPAYLKAARRLRSWQFPLEEMAAILGTQSSREGDPQSLAQVAEPTVAATALVFSQGAKLCGRPEMAQPMYEVGAKFGYLIYVLDAYEDRERDARSGSFNATRAFPNFDARKEIRATSEELERMLSPALAHRLRTNVEQRLQPGLPIMATSCRTSLRGRFRAAVAFARALREREHAGMLKGAAVLASVSLLAFLFPHYALKSQSWRQCLGVSMNLMALSSVFSSTPQPPFSPRPYNPQTATPPPQNAGRSGGCPRCSCGDCFADCCCEGCCDACCSSCG